ncbi:endoglucanase [Vulcanisaeta sp. JCM 16161]
MTANRKHIIISLIFAIIIVLTIILIFFLTSELTLMNSRTVNNRCICKENYTCLVLNSSLELPGSSTYIIAWGNNKYEIYINMWNLANFNKGYAKMTYNPNKGILCFYALINNVTLKNPESQVWGYPEIFLIGRSPWLKTPTNEVINLPQRINDLLSSYPNLSIYVNYTLIHSPSTPIDWAYDIWFLRNPNITGVGPGDAEMMIWLYYSGYNTQWAYTGINVNIPIYVNGTLTNETFMVLINCNHGTGWTYIAFVPVNDGYRSGNIGIWLAPFLNYMVTLLPQKCPSIWQSPDNVSDLWLMDVELGSEFGNMYVSSSEIYWKIYNISIVK